MVDQSFRDRVSSAICGALRPLPSVLAGWEGGSAAFGKLDGYSDIDLTFLVDDHVSFDILYAAAENSLETVSPIVMSHSAPPGCYYKLLDGGEFFLVDLCFLRTEAPDHYLDVERHGHVVPLFDKGEWLEPKPLNAGALTINREKRYRELRGWFVVSQDFVRKAILRGQRAEAMTFYWAYTIKPLAELLRMRYCPVRWDFGMRYLDRDLPPAVSDQIQNLVFIRDLADLQAKLDTAIAWGAAVLSQLDSAAEQQK